MVYFELKSLLDQAQNDWLSNYYKLYYLTDTFIWGILYILKGVIHTPLVWFRLSPLDFLFYTRTIDGFLWQYLVCV